MYYLQLPVQEGKRGDLEHWLAVGIVFCITHLQQTQEYRPGRRRRVLVHCAQGKDRSVAMVMALLLTLLSNENVRFPLQFHDSTLQSFPLQELFDALLHPNTSRSGSKEAVDEWKTKSEGITMYHSSGLPATVIHGLLGRCGRNVLLDVVQRWKTKTQVTASDMGIDNKVETNSALIGTPTLSTINKRAMRIVLHLIKQDRIVADPSRSTMQKLNRFFMSQEYENSQPSVHLGRL
jgi:hypothetical protein